MPLLLYKIHYSWCEGLSCYSAWECLFTVSALSTLKWLCSHKEVEKHCGNPCVINFWLTRIEANKAAMKAIGDIGLGYRISSPREEKCMRSTWYARKIPNAEILRILWLAQIVSCAHNKIHAKTK